MEPMNRGQESEGGAPDATVMVVDDTVENLDLLDQALRGQGYGVVSFPSGRLALAAAAREPPDLVLLDVNMPDLNGYEVCERFKRDTLLAAIPVIFISAYNEPMDKVRAFGCGGVDYVTKPFQIEDVFARIATHLRITRLQRSVEQKNRMLEEANGRLARLQRYRDEMTHLLVHDMRSPLLGIFGNLEFMLDQGAHLQAADRETLADALASSRRLIEMVSSILDIGRLEAGQMPLRPSTCSVADIARHAVRTLNGVLTGRPVDIESPAGDAAVTCDEALVQRVLVNLIDNAAKYSPPDSPIRVTCTRQEAMARVAVADRGPGIPVALRERIFEKYGQLENPGPVGRPSTGLGLAFCSLAIAAHGGRIGVESDGRQGSEFWFTLPLAADGSEV